MNGALQEDAEISASVGGGKINAAVFRLSFQLGVGTEGHDVGLIFNERWRLFGDIDGF